MKLQVTVAYASANSVLVCSNVFYNSEKLICRIVNA